MLLSCATARMKTANVEWALLSLPLFLHWKKCHTQCDSVLARIGVCSSQCYLSESSLWSTPIVCKWVNMFSPICDWVDTRLQWAVFSIQRANKTLALQKLVEWEISQTQRANSWKFHQSHMWVFLKVISSSIFKPKQTFCECPANDLSIGHWSLLGCVWLISNGDGKVAWERFSQNHVNLRQMVTLKFQSLEFLNFMSRTVCLDKAPQNSSNHLFLFLFLQLTSMEAIPSALQARWLHCLKLSLWNILILWIANQMKDQPASNCKGWWCNGPCANVDFCCSVICTSQAWNWEIAFMAKCHAKNFRCNIVVQWFCDSGLQIPLISKVNWFAKETWSDKIRSGNRSGTIHEQIPWAALTTHTDALIESAWWVVLMSNIVDVFGDDVVVCCWFRCGHGEWVGEMHLMHAFRQIKK